MTKLSTKQKKDVETDVTWDKVWLKESILKQLNFLRKMIYLYLEVTGLLSKFINKYSKNKEKFSFLELGCGGSSYLPYLAVKYKNLQLFGIDKSEMGCKLAKIGIDGKFTSANIVIGDFFKSPLRPEKFDIVFSLGLLEHFDEPEKIIKKHVDLLKPGGLLICVVPNFFGIQRKIYGLEFWYPDDMPLEYKKGKVWGMKCISIKDLEGWFEDIGLDDIRAQPIGGIYPFIIFESYRPEFVPLSFKIFYFIYRYFLFLPSIVVNIPFIFRLNSQSLSPFFIAVGVKTKKKQIKL